MNTVRSYWQQVRRNVPTRGQCWEFLHRRVLRRPMRFRDVHGLAYEFAPDDAFAWCIDQGSVLDDPALSHFVERTVRPGDTVFDVGANIGGFSLLAGRLAGHRGRICAFEPEPENFRQLKRNAALNGLDGRITAFNQAVSSAAGSVQLSVFDRRANGWNTMGWFEQAGHAPQGTVRVQAVTLDDFCRERGIEHIDLLKVDVEGAEPEVLTGACGLLAAGAITRVVFEVSLVPMQGMKHEVEDTLRPLAAAGYVVEAINPDGTLRATSADEIRGTFFGNYVASRPALGAAPTSTT